MRSDKVVRDGWSVGVGTGVVGTECGVTRGPEARGAVGPNLKAYPEMTGQRLAAKAFVAGVG